MWFHFTINESKIVPLQLGWVFVFSSIHETAVGIMRDIWEWNFILEKTTGQFSIHVFSTCKVSLFPFVQHFSSSSAASLGANKSVTAWLHSASVYQNSSMGSHSEDCTWASLYVLFCLNLIHIYVNFSHTNILQFRYTINLFSFLFSSIFSFSFSLLASVY